MNMNESVLSIDKMSIYNNLKSIVLENAFSRVNPMLFYQIVLAYEVIVLASLIFPISLYSLTAQLKVRQDYLRKSEAF